VERCIAEHGERPAAYLDRVGLLGRRTMLAHCVWLDDAELDLVAERGATIVTNPVANMKLAVGGTFRYPAARQRGIPVALGTDGAGSNNSLDLFQDMKLFALAQKNAAGDPAAVTAPEAFEVAAGLRAPLVAPWGGAGPLQAGGPADFLLVRTAAAELTPGDLTSNLVYAASGGIVDTTIVHGRVLMRGGIVDGADEIRDHALEQARRLGTAR
jgi:5-methylthioadenosine/S-adenosylhomocysteine deaminase